MISRSILSKLVTGLFLASFLAACNSPGVRPRVGVHVGVGYSPYWRYYGPPPVVVPPPGGPDVELPIEPPVIATPLPEIPEPGFGGDFGGGFGGDFGGDFGGLDF